MKYTEKEIKERLLEEDYPNNPVLLESVTSQILSLTDEGEEKFIEWFETKKLFPFNINGITPDFLRKYHAMKDVAIILCYARLKKDPNLATLLKRPVIKNKSL